MSSPTPSAGVVVREATPADLPDVAKLLSARDEMSRDPAIVGKYLWGLDPTHTATWLAYVDGRPVGITMLYLRDVRWPNETTVETLRCGYWAHLFVEPEFRRLMIYPQLVLAMLRGISAKGLSIIYTATRQPTVAEGHQKLGFALVGKWPLQLRPIRPFRLLAKHENIKLPGFVIGVLDTVAQPFIKRRVDRTVKVVEIPLADERIGEVCALMNSRDMYGVQHDWPTDEFRCRFATTLDGTEYRVFGVELAGRIVAAVVTTLIERGNNIRAGVILSLVADVVASSADVNALLAKAEQLAYENDAELVLALDESLELQQLKSLGGKYLVTDSENYHMLVYPKKYAQSPYKAADLANWVFDYADHDAF
jgi:N-acetylglutamate synthase-like GNAT family acetyltransferase